MTMLDHNPHLQSADRHELHDLAAPAGDEIIAVANAATAAADHRRSAGELVIVARTSNGGHRAVGGGALGPVRAAISVAVAAGNSRLWSNIVGTDTIQHQTRSLPEIVRAAVEAVNVTTVFVGCIHDESVAAVAVWLEVEGNVADATERNAVMELLSAAAERQREFFAKRNAAQAALDAANEGAATQSGGRFDRKDASTDNITGLATASDFEAALHNYESDEATLVVVDLDGFADVAATYGEVISNAILREIAERLDSSCRRDDLIARIGPDAFAILFADAPRSVGLHIAKRLLDTIALPLPVAGGPEFVTATVALAHQFGLVDMDELRESAEGAIASGKRSGVGRLVIAS